MVEIARFSAGKLMLSSLPGLAFGAGTLVFGVHTFGGYANQTFSMERVQAHSVIMIVGGVFVLLAFAKIFGSAVAKRGVAIYTDGQSLNVFDQRFRSAALDDIVSIECVDESFSRPRHVRINLRSGRALTPQVHFMRGTPEQIRQRLVAAIDLRT